MIALVISDVDSTLVTPGKRLTDASIKAGQKLHTRGTGFSLTSSRPPFGLRMLVEPLSLKLPLDAFNGAALVKRNGEVIEIHLVPELAARRSVDFMRRCGVDVWLYTTDRWLVLDQRGAYVHREVDTILTEPTVVADLSPHLGCVAKIVGVPTYATKQCAQPNSSRGNRDVGRYCSKDIAVARRCGRHTGHA